MAKRPVAIREPIVGTVVTGHVGKPAWKASSLHSAVGFLHPAGGCVYMRGVDRSTFCWYTWLPISSASHLLCVAFDNWI